RAAATANAQRANEEAARAVAASEQAVQEKELTAFQARRASSARHAAQLQLAVHAWREDDLLEAERVLGSVDPLLEATLEQRFVRGLCDRKTQLLIGPGPGVLRLAITPDGKHVVTTTGNTATVWDRETGKKSLTFQEHVKPILAVAISAD